MRGAPVPPAPPNKSGILRPGLELASPLATAKLRPPQATGGTSHPRGAQHAMQVVGRQRKIHKILGYTDSTYTTPRRRIEIGFDACRLGVARTGATGQPPGSSDRKCPIRRA